MDKQRSSEQGAITILVVLLLLVLLTVLSVGMSQNSLREVMVTGTQRQAIEVRNVADNGLEWSIYWLNPAARAGVSSGPGSDFSTIISSIMADTSMLGQEQTLAGTASPMVQTSGALTNTYSVTVARFLDHMDMPFTSTVAGVKPISPILWRISSTGTVSNGTISFDHTRESWVLAPPQ
jgi:hypothetical protein